MFVYVYGITNLAKFDNHDSPKVEQKCACIAEIIHSPEIAFPFRRRVRKPATLIQTRKQRSGPLDLSLVFKPEGLSSVRVVTCCENVVKEQLNVFRGKPLNDGVLCDIADAHPIGTVCWKPGVKKPSVIQDEVFEGIRLLGREP